jgi:hypothetical protein
MDWYPWIVFVHAAAVLLFFVAHGTSMAVAFRLKSEEDPARIRALLDLSTRAMGLVPSIAFIIGLLAGIAAGIMGGHFGRFWIWISLGLLVAVVGYMTPAVAVRLNAIRAAAGTQSINPFSRSVPQPPPPGDPSELRRLVAAWNPAPAAIVGLAAFLAILWLMFFQPF